MPIHRIAALLAVLTTSVALAQQPLRLAGGAQKVLIAADTTPAPSFRPTLKAGEKTTRATPDLQRVAIGDSDIADLTTDAGSVTLEGVSAGQTTVLLWFADGRREQWLVTVVK